MAPPGKRSSFFLLENILYLHSSGSLGGHGRYLALHAIEGECRMTFPALLTMRIQMKHFSHLCHSLAMTAAARTGERQRLRSQGWLSMLMVSVDITAAEPSKDGVSAQGICLSRTELRWESRNCTFCYLVVLTQSRRNYLSHAGFLILQLLTMLWGFCSKHQGSQ